MSEAGGWKWDPFWGARGGKGPGLAFPTDCCEDNQAINHSYCTECVVAQGGETYTKSVQPMTVHGQGSKPAFATPPSGAEPVPSVLVSTSSVSLTHVYRARSYVGIISTNLQSVAFNHSATLPKVSYLLLAIFCMRTK